MKKNNPYYYTTKHFLHTYHGGGYDLEHLLKCRRGTIKTFTRSSMKRLCLKFDSIIGFEPEWKIVITYNGLPEWNIIKKTINKFTARLSLSMYSNEKPIWIWKKNIIGGNITIIVITNIKPIFGVKTFKLASEYYWQHYSPVIINKICSEKLKSYENIITDFCFNNTIDAAYPFGKWWGIINQTYYEKIPVIKNECSITEIEIIELKNNKNHLITSDFKKNLYKK